MDRIRHCGRSLDEWLDWQSSLNPHSIDLGLDRLQRVWRSLREPPVARHLVTVAGTNGKGSCVAFLEQIYSAAGYRTGSYTSPHLHRYNERIRIVGREAGDAAICDAFERIEAVRDAEALTYFEFGTLAALLLFAAADLDVAILEVGLGGRLDAVNLVDADVALISGIALDHQDWLGDDREAIAREKAGIMRENRPIVFGSSNMPDAIAEVAGRLGASLSRAGRDFGVRRLPNGWHWDGAGGARRSLPFPTMRGAHQLDNAAAALQVVGLLAGHLPVDQAAARSGLLDARVPGRFEVYPGDVTWIYDVAHNPQAALTLSAMLGEQYVAGSTHAIIGMLGDKDVDGVLRALANRVDNWLVVDLSTQARGMLASDLLERLLAVVPSANACLFGDVATALETTRQMVHAGDRVLVAGSFLVVGPALQSRETAGADPQGGS